MVVVLALIRAAASDAGGKLFPIRDTGEANLLVTSLRCKNASCGQASNILRAVWRGCSGGKGELPTERVPVADHATAWYNRSCPPSRFYGFIATRDLPRADAAQ
jgi:hypothetical protein